MIQVCGLSKRFGRVSAVEQVTFSVAAQAQTALVGPSGCGKTTLLRLIAGLELPDEGTIYLDGALVSRPGWALSPYQRRVGFVFQAPALWPHLTVAQNIAFGLNGCSKIDSRRRLAEVLEQAGLQQLAKRYPAQLSGGEARRVSLARTLAPRPPYLLLDEPLTNLDQDSRDDLLQLILNAVSASGATLIYVTHDPLEAGRISACPLRMDRGRMEPAGQAGDYEDGRQHPRCQEETG